MSDSSRQQSPTSDIESPIESSNHADDEHPRASSPPPAYVEPPRWQPHGFTRSAATLPSRTDGALASSIERWLRGDPAASDPLAAIDTRLDAEEREVVALERLLQGPLFASAFPWQSSMTTITTTTRSFTDPGLPTYGATVAAPPSVQGHDYASRSALFAQRIEAISARQADLERRRQRAITAIRF